MRGFTLIEIAIVIAVSTFITYGAYISFSSFRDVQVLTADSEQILALLYEARTASVAGKYDTTHGVHFDTTLEKISFFRGTSFVSGVLQEEFTLHSRVEISSVALINSGTDIIFGRLTGEPSTSGTITLRLRNTPTETKIIRIEPTGAVSLE